MLIKETGTYRTTEPIKKQEGEKGIIPTGVIFNVTEIVLAGAISPSFSYLLSTRKDWPVEQLNNL